MALLTIRDDDLGRITWEAPEDSPVAILMEDAQTREMLMTDVKRLLLLYHGALSSGPVAAQGLEEISRMISMLARIQLRRLKRATQN